MKQICELKKKLEKTDVLFKGLFKLTNMCEVSRRTGAVLLLDGPEGNPALSSVVTENRHSLVKVGKTEEAKEYITKNEVRLFIVDLQSTTHGMEILEWVKFNHPDLPIMASVKDSAIQEAVETKFPDVELVIDGIVDVRCKDVLDCIKEPGSVQLGAITYQRA